MSKYFEITVWWCTDFSCVTNSIVASSAKKQQIERPEQKSNIICKKNDLHGLKKGPAKYFENSIKPCNYNRQFMICEK